MKIRNSFVKPEQCELHKCLRLLARLCRWFGFFPVEGLDSPYIDKVKFNLKSIYSIYLVSSIFGLFIKCVIAFGGLAVNSFSFVIFQKLLLHSSALISAFLFLKLSQNWPTMLRKAAVIEMRVKGIRTTRNTSRKTNLAVWIFTSMAVVHVVLSYLYRFRIVLNCSREVKITYNVLKKLTLSLNKFFFECISYNIGLAIYLTIAHFQALFLWTASDLMIMGSSMYLFSYFRDLNTVIFSLEPKAEKDWALLRLYYSQLVELVNEVDAQLNIFIFLSFSLNLFLSCIHLFNSLKINGGEIIPGCDSKDLKRAIDGDEHFAFYSFSFFFLMARALCLYLQAAQVHYESKEPSVALVKASTTIYSIEIQRFYRQIHYTTTCLSGSFFYVTRNMILQILGNVLTYELVLLPLNSEEKPTELYSNNDILSNVTSVMLNTTRI